MCNVNPSLTKMEETTGIKLDDNKKECGEDRTNADRAQGNIENRCLVKTEQEPIKQISTLQSSSNTAVTPLGGFMVELNMDIFVILHFL